MQLNAKRHGVQLHKPQNCYHGFAAWRHILAPTVSRFEPLLFFRWIFLKEKMCSQKHNTISDLENAIEIVAAAITPRILSKVQVSFKKTALSSSKPLKKSRKKMK